MTTTYQKIRPPAVAGRFYRAEPIICKDEARQLLDADPPIELPSRCFGGVVPHAGWVFSGRVAAQVIAAMARVTGDEAVTIFLTGSVHTTAIWGPMMDSADAWHTPLGPVAVDDDLRRQLMELPGFGALDMAHEREHSLEVELPLIRLAFGDRAKILPCLIPPATEATDWGQAIGDLLATRPGRILVVCSTDLTHYGPNYRFAPEGVGPEGCDWAYQVNDKRMVALMEAMDGPGALKDAQWHHSACGGGAIAASIIASRRLGANRGVLLKHTDSRAAAATLGMGEQTNSVGYAGMLFMD